MKKIMDSHKTILSATCLLLSTANADDIVEESQNIKFIIDVKSMVHLDGCRVDFDDGLNGKGFEIQNPNAQITCGCGKSFN